MGPNALALLKEAAEELSSIYDNEYQLRDKYPVLQRKYERDMDLVKRINAYLICF